MQFSREDKPRNAITRYDDETIRVAGTEYRGSVAITADTIMTDWRCADIDALDTETLAPLVALAPEAIVVGAGATVRFPPAETMRGVMRDGIGIEVMNDGAAVRTFNVMLAEGRRVVLALVRGD